jgi:tetratricopeptide (TPR) repeat protein
LLSFGSLEDWKHCLEHVEPTLEKQRSLLGELDPDTLASVHTYLFAATSIHPKVDTIAIARTYVANAQKVYANDPEKRLEAQRTLAWVLIKRDRSSHGEEIDTLLGNSIADSERILGATHHTTLRLKESLAGFYRRAGDFVRSEQLLLETIQSREITHGRTSPKLIGLYNTLAVLLSEQDKVAEAETAMRHAANLTMRHLPRVDPDLVAVVVGNQAHTLNEQGKYVEAQQLLEEALPRVLDGCMDAYGRNGRRFLSVLAVTYLNAGREDEVLEILAEPIKEIVRAEGLETCREEEILAQWSVLQLSLRGAEELRRELARLNEESSAAVPQDALERIFQEILEKGSVRAGH